MKVELEASKQSIQTHRPDLPHLDPSRMTIAGLVSGLPVLQEGVAGGMSRISISSKLAAYNQL